MNGLPSLTNSVPLWVAIVAVLTGAIGGLIIACTPACKAWLERRKILAEARSNDAQTEKALVETRTLRLFGNPDGSLIERIGHATEQAWARLDKQEEVIFQQADEIKRLDNDSKESKRLHELCEVKVERLQAEVRRLKG